MELTEMRDIIAKYDRWVKKFNSIGCEVEEVSGYSDRHYYYIGVTVSPNYRKKVRLLFTASNVYDFFNRADAFFKGLEYGAGK